MNDTKFLHFMAVKVHQTLSLPCIKYPGASLIEILILTGNFNFINNAIGEKNKQRLSIMLNISQKLVSLNAQFQEIETKMSKI